MSQERVSVVERNPLSDANDEFARLTGDFITARFAAHPVLATALGVPNYDDQLDSFDRFLLRAERDEVRAYLHALDKLSPVTFSADNRVDCRLARSYAQRVLLALEQQKWPECHPGACLETLVASLSLLMAPNQEEATPRVLNLLHRLRAVPVLLLEARGTLTQPPRLFTEIALDRAESCQTFLTSTLPAFIAEIPAPVLQKALNSALMLACTALTEYASFLRKELLPRSTGDFAIGRELFVYLLRVGHLVAKERAVIEAVEEVAQEVLEAAKRTEEGEERAYGEDSPSEGRPETLAAMEATPELLDAYALDSDAPGKPFSLQRRFFMLDLTEGGLLCPEEAERLWCRSTDPRFRLSQQPTLRERACLALVDAHLHTRQITPEEAARFLECEAPMEPAVARASVRRCAQAPTLAAASLLDRHALLALLAEVQRRQGARFNPRTLQAQLRTCRGLPPVLVREVIFSR